MLAAESASNSDSQNTLWPTNMWPAKDDYHVPVHLITDCTHLVKCRITNHTPYKLRPQQVRLGLRKLTKFMRVSSSERSEICQQAFLVMSMVCSRAGCRQTLLRLVSIMHYPIYTDLGQSVNCKVMLSIFQPDLPNHIFHVEILIISYFRFLVS